MATINKNPRRPVALTHEGAPAARPMTPLHELRRAVLSCLLWENQFYESGQDISDRIVSLVGRCRSVDVAALAAEARRDFNLRHVPLLLVSAMVENDMKPSRNLVSAVIQRPDEMGELISILWRKGKRPIPKQVKLGIGDAFKGFNAYSLGKYNRSSAAIKLIDVLRLTHPKDGTEAMRQLVEGTLETPDTWETNLSAGADKKETFERLISEGKLGSLALLRNLRNMQQAGCDETLVNNAIRTVNHDRTLPFRFISAARAAPRFEPALDAALVSKVGNLPIFDGKTIVLVDVSGSMVSKISAWSDLTRMDAACALASIFPGEDVRTFSFSTHVMEVPRRIGMAGVDALRSSQHHGGTNLDAAIEHINRLPHDRLVVISDEQFSGRVRAPVAERAYMINVASAQNGVSYSDWIKIDGFSESVLTYMKEMENWVA